MTNDISEIISKCLEIPSVQHRCTRTKNMTFSEGETVVKELSRVIGYCILFRSSDDIDKYLSIKDKDEQISFLKSKVASIMGIPPEEIATRMNEIVSYVYENFKQNGFVFHGANSLSIKEKMTNGIKVSNDDQQHKDQILKIANIFKKYGNDKPMGWGELDIIHGNNGWFYDGFPKDITYYADSPEWFNQFCGENGAYYMLVPEELRHGYRNRDYDSAKEAITILMDKNQMSEEDRQIVISFFNSKWELFKDTYPGVILVPVSKIRSQEELNKRRLAFLPRYLKNPDYLFEDVIKCIVDKDFNVCCKKDISPEGLSSLDLTPILPRFKVQRNQEKSEAINRIMMLLRSGEIAGKLSIEDLKAAEEYISGLMQEREGVK